MERKDYARLVVAWIALQRAAENSPLRDGLDWADEKMWRLTFYDPDMAWEAILEVLRTDSSNKVMENLSAGPLEDLLGRYGDRIIDRVEREARANKKFRDLLGGVWQNAMSDEIWKRVQAVAGENW